MGDISVFPNNDMNRHQARQMIESMTNDELDYLSELIGRKLIANMTPEEKSLFHSFQDPVAESIWITSHFPSYVEAIISCLEELRSSSSSSPSKNLIENATSEEQIKHPISFPMQQSCSDIIQTSRPPEAALPSRLSPQTRQDQYGSEEEMEAGYIMISQQMRTRITKTREVACHEE